MKQIFALLAFFVAFAGSALAQDSIYQPPTPIQKLVTTPGSQGSQMPGIATDEYLRPKVLTNGVNPDSFNPNKQFHAISAAITDPTPVAVATAIPTPTGTPATTVYHITDWVVSNMHASVDTNVILQCGTVSKETCPAAHAGGGCVHPMKTEIVCAASDDIKCKSVTTGASITCSVSGYFSTY